MKPRGDLEGYEITGWHVVVKGRAPEKSLHEAMETELD